MSKLGQAIRDLRDGKKLPLRTIAAYLDIDQAILSKIERGQRKASREQVIKLAQYFKASENELLTAWLSDKVIYELKGEDMALDALRAAETEISYRTTKPKKVERQANRKKIQKLIRQYFQLQDKVSKAWLFGSFARGDDSEDSDIDIIIDVSQEKKFTLFDIAGIKKNLENIVNKKVDVVMLHGVRPEVKTRIKDDMLLIYEA